MICLAIAGLFGDNLSFFPGEMVLNVYFKDPEQQAKACVIWMHGLGADATDMSGLVEQLPIGHLPLRHVFLDAPVRSVTINGGMSMRAWYDILAMEITARQDKKGVVESQQEILTIVDQQIEAGFLSSQIYLAGFSQGGAMALHTGLHMTSPLAGIIALSAYIPLIDECKPSLAPSTPIFIANGSFDPIVWPLWTKESIKWLEAKGFNAICHYEYPMEHTICIKEITDLSHWLTQQVQGE